MKRRDKVGQGVVEVAVVTHHVIGEECHHWWRVLGSIEHKKEDADVCKIFEIQSSKCDRYMYVR